MYPLPKFIKSDKWPFCTILDFEFICKLLITAIVFWLQLNAFTILEIYSHDIESKAFSKSTKTINPLLPLNFVSFKMSSVKTVCSPIILS